jgi:N-acetylneuraminic acid mutarotase
MPTPVAVDDAVSGVWRDSLVYLVSGWHDTDNVQLVQVYDAVRNRWHVATSIPGPGVFGHSGALAGNVLLYIDGAARQPGPVKYGLVPQSWMGTIDPANPLHITWRRVSQHPGAPRYRAAAGACGRWVVIAGGTSNPYNYNGVGYNGEPSEPRAEVLAFDTRTGSWTSWPAAPRRTMDHRGLVVARDSAYVIGGMRDRQTVSVETLAWPLPSCRT